MELERRQARESLAAFGSASRRADLLDYANLGQLIDAIRHQWKRFRPLLEDKASLDTKLNEFHHWRNKLAHGVQPTPDQKARIVFLASDLGHSIPSRPVAFPGASEAPRPKGYGLVGCRVLWADDHPENNLMLRDWLVRLGATVIPVLTNDEALDEAMRAEFDMAVSDIARDDDGEPGDLLGVRLKAAGIDVPIVFFVGEVDPDRPLPAGGIAITDDEAELLYHVLQVLRGH